MALAQLRREGYPPPLYFEHTMCVSRYLRDSLVAGGALPESASVLYNGIDPSPFTAAPAPTAKPEVCPLRLLYFGSLLPIKGVHVALRAMELLREQGVADRVELTILGRGHPSYVARLHAMIAGSGLKDRVHFEDWIARSDVPYMLKQHQVLLFTSTGPEAMARTVMEAMAAGLAVVGSCVGGQKEMLIHEENSLPFAPGDAEQLSRHVRRLLDEPHLLCRISKAGQQAVLAQFTLARMVTEVESWLLDIAR